MPIVSKEFEIYCEDKLERQQRDANISDLSLSLYIGHKHDDSNISNFFSFDLGQIILSEGT
jgi:hypothetical protein